MGEGLTEAQICTFFAEGRLAANLTRSRGDIAVLAASHNSGKIDLFTLIEGGDLLALGGPAFFTAAHVFGEILPALDGPLDRVMSVVETLVERGGHDYAASAPNGNFKAWLIAHPGQAEQLVDQARRGDELAARHLTFALEVLGDVSGAREIASMFHGNRQWSALTTLSRLPDTEEGYLLSLETLQNLIGQGEDEITLGQTILTAASILSRGDATVREKAGNLILSIVKQHGPTVRPTVAQALWMNPDVAETKALQPLLDLLGETDPEHLGSINQIDHVVRHFLEKGKTREASGLVFNLLKNSDGRIAIEKLQSFTHGLFTRPAREVGQVVIDWLMSGDKHVCDALSHLLQQDVMEGRPLEIDADMLPASDADKVFLCHKAVGWLVFIPISATSVLVAVHANCSGALQDEIGQLTLDMLLNNYSCALEYAKTRATGAPPDSPLQGLIGAAETYLHAWEAVPRIRELDPSDDQRRIQYFRQSDEMREVHKTAHERSIFASLFKHATILYGSSMLALVKDVDGTRRQVEGPMNTFSVSKEVPRQLSINPIGFDQTVRRLRTIGRPA